MQDSENFTLADAVYLLLGILYNNVSIWHSSGQFFGFIRDVH